MPDGISGTLNTSNIESCVTAQVMDSEREHSVNERLNVAGEIILTGVTDRNYGVM